MELLTYSTKTLNKFSYGSSGDSEGDAFTLLRGTITATSSLIGRANPNMN